MFLLTLPLWASAKVTRTFKSRKTQGKPAYVNAETLAGIRKVAIAECAAATEALIIGVHPPLSSQEDETLW